MIAFSAMGETPLEKPMTYFIRGNPIPAVVVYVGGDLRKIIVVRSFWQMVIAALNEEPSALWLNLTTVETADTKLAACIVAILHRCKKMKIKLHVVGSQAVQDTFNACKFPPITQFTKTRSIA